MIFTNLVESPLGILVVGVIGGRVCLLEFNVPERVETQRADLQRWFQCPVHESEHPLHGIVRKEVDGYFSGSLREFSLPLAFPGTAFQQIVWKALLKIPYGETRSYEDVAKMIGVPNATRAVGTANGRNRLAILIPCHRVVNKDGRLGGYGGGLWRKQYLLSLERGFETAASNQALV